MTPRFSNNSVKLLIGPSPISKNRRVCSANLSISAASKFAKSGIVKPGKRGGTTSMYLNNSEHMRTANSRKVSACERDLVVADAIDRKLGADSFSRSNVENGLLKNDSGTLSSFASRNTVSADGAAAKPSN